MKGEANMTLSDFLLQIVSTLVGITMGIAVPLLKKTVQKWVAGVISVILLIISLIWIGYEIGKQGATTYATEVVPINVFKRIDFENGLSNSTTIGICDDIPGELWYDHCQPAQSKLSIENDGFNSIHSLGIEVESLPQKRRVFTTRFPLDPPVFADSVSALIYNPVANKFSKIILAAQIKGEEGWIIGELVVKETGWVRLFLDLQKYPTSDGKRASDVGIQEIHIDVFVNEASGQSEEYLLLVDDIELYFPHATSHLNK